MLEGTIQVIGSSLLGLTFQCARCHDHKFEPVTQKAYYQLQAILYPAFPVEHWLKPNERVVVAGPRVELSRWEAKEKAIDAELAALERSFAGRPEATQEEGGSAQADDRGDRRPSEAEPRPDRLGRRRVERPRRGPAPAAGQSRDARPGGRPGRTGILDRSRQPVRSGAALAGLGSTGRRLALARWLTKPGSRPAALLARVPANRIWQHHFGTGLVATPENLGYTGSPPTHPELLEFLADDCCAGLEPQGAAPPDRELDDLSAVERTPPGAAQVDPDNRLLARYPLRRLDAESVRDAMLAASGELDDRPGGPYVPTDRADSGEVVVDESAPGRPPAVGLSPAAPHPDRQPARCLRRPLHRHHLHAPPPFDRPAPVAQPAQLRLRRGPGR